MEKTDNHSNGQNPLYDKLILRRKNNETKKRKKHPACSPFAKKNSVNSKTCYTLGSLLEIRDKYNKIQPPNLRIKTSNPKKLWKTLKTRFSKKQQCKEKGENCWLKIISDPNLSKKIDQEIFAPKTPPEWTQNPKEWLSNWDISNVLRQYEKIYPEFIYFEPSPIDFDERPSDIGGGKCVSQELCEFSLEKIISQGKNKVGFVFNLDKHTSNGSHWVSMFLDLKDKFIFYFDSVGEKIPDEIATLKDRIIEQARQKNINIEFISNNGSLHQYGNSECGMYSLFFIVTMLTTPTRKNNKNIRKSDKILLFNGNRRIPDKIMQEYRNIYFTPYDE